LTLASNSGRLLVSQRANKRAPHAAVNGFKHLINNRGTVARDVVKKIVSSLRGANLNPVAIQSASAPRR
jgi:hypothetical protein